MKASRRSRLIERHRKRNSPLAEINAVSLMDIFTILVFFLLIHSSDVETLPSTKSVKLPASVADKAPKQNLVLMVNDEDIVVQGRRVASVAEVFAGGDVIEPLKAELDYQAGRSPAPAPGQLREIIIMGDKEISYQLLKKIMMTCVRAHYEGISLAVMKKASEAGGGT